MLSDRLFVRHIRVLQIQKESQRSASLVCFVQMSINEDLLDRIGKLLEFNGGKSTTWVDEEEFFSFFQEAHNFFNASDAIPKYFAEDSRHIKQTQYPVAHDAFHFGVGKPDPRRDLLKENRTKYYVMLESLKKIIASGGLITPLTPKPEVAISSIDQIHYLNVVTDSKMQVRGRPLESKYSSGHIIVGKKSAEIPKNAPKLRVFLDGIYALTKGKPKDAWALEWEEVYRRDEGDAIELTDRATDAIKKHMRYCVMQTNKLLDK